MTTKRDQVITCLQSKNDESVEELAEKIMNIFLDDNTKGGVYCINYQDIFNLLANESLGWEFEPNEVHIKVGEFIRGNLKPLLVFDYEWEDDEA